MSASQYYNVASMHTMIANAILDINNQGIEDYRYEGYGFGSSSIISNIRPSIAKQLHDTRLASFMAEEGTRLAMIIEPCVRKLAIVGDEEYLEVVVDGFVALNFCSDRFDSGQGRCALLHDLTSIKDRFQFALYHLFQRLTGYIEWEEKEKSMVENGDFEVSFILWAIKLGPRGLASEWGEGKSTAEIVLAAEDFWVMSHIEKSNYEDKRRLLRDFAESLRIWGSDLVDRAKEEDTAEDDDDDDDEEDINA